MYDVPEYQNWKGTVDECKAQCLALSWCTGFNTRPNNGTCDLKKNAPANVRINPLSEPKVHNYYGLTRNEPEYEYEWSEYIDHYVSMFDVPEW